MEIHLVIITIDLRTRYYKQITESGVQVQNLELSSTEYHQLKQKFSHSEKRKVKAIYKGVSYTVK